MELNDAVGHVLQNDLQSEYSAMIDDVLHTLDGTFAIQNSNVADTMYNPPSVSSVSSTSSSSPTFTNLSQPSTTNLEGVRIKIVEEPAPKGLRFRYICEGRSAGSIPGIHSTPENKTFPTIEIEGYEGKVKIVVSCVTKDEPYRPHPHNLVGKENCEHGVCTMRLNGPPMRAVFSNLGIQCVKKKDIRAALEERERKRIDPFKTKFAHKDKPSEIDLNVVRLCFQAFIPIPGPQKYYKIPPVVSEPIYDKKSINDLVICRMCSCSAKVTGGAEIFLLCEKVPKDDIKIRFYEEKNNELYWEDYAEFKQADVHKQSAIAFKTPRYINPDINHKVQVNIQLYRPSDGEKSEPLPFEFYPDPGMRTFPRIQRKLKRKQDMEIFQQILSLDSETTATKYSVPSTVEATENYNDNDDTVTSDSTASKPLSPDTLNENEEVQKRENESFEDVDDDTGNYNYIERNDGDMEIELPVPQFTFPTTDDSTQTSTPIEEILRDRALAEETRQLTTLDKIKEWMKSNEFERTDSLIVENGDNMSLGGTDVNGKKPLTESNNNDKDTNMTSQLNDEQINTDLIEQDIELENKFSLELLAKNRNENLQDQPVFIKDNPLFVDDCGRHIEEIIDNLNCSASADASVDTDENFDETATYTSLQIALKNPIEIPIDQRINKKYDRYAKEEKDLVVLTNPPAPKIKVNAAQTPQTPSSPPLPLPPRTPSPIVDQMLPPLPPKRKLSQELWAGTDSSPCLTAGSSRNSSISSRPPSQIIIMRTPDQSPTKRSATSTPSPKKKQGFFSRIFSRRKSKAEPPLSADESNSKVTTPNQSREPSIGNFSLNDNNRSSIRSVKSLQPNSLGLEPKSCEKSGKAVGRSVSSVSGKRPAHRNANVIHIPLKGDSSDKCYSSSCTLRYDGGLLDRKTLSALQLADIPISDGNMELIAIADRQSIKNLCEGAYGVVLDPSVDLSEAEHFALYTTTLPPHNDDSTNNENSIHFNQPILTAEEVALRLAAANDNIKRKRLRTGGHPINMFQEIQQFDQSQNQNQMQYNNVNSTNMDFWKVQAPTPSASSTVPEIKPEPYLSPIYYGGTYRNTYQASPSPQPLSPMMNRNINTPSPNGLMRNSSAESQTQMSFAYNQSQMNITDSQYQNMSNNFDMSNNPFRESTNNPNHNISNSNMLSPLQTQFASFNPSFNRTSGGSITPIYANDNLNNDNNANNQILNTPELSPMKFATNNTHTLQGSAQNNLMLNQFQGTNTAATSANNNTTQFQALNIPNNIINGQDIPGTSTNSNVMLNQFQDTNVSAVSAATAEGFLNNLLLIDSNDFVDVNSDELRNISNLSIST